MKYEVTLSGRTYAVEVELSEPMNMQEFRSHMPTPAAPVSEPAPVNVPAAAPAAAPAITGEGERVDSPMPGNILNVLVAPGQMVKEGDILVILEAMKMENEIIAPRNGTITQVLVSKGTVVETGTPLVVIN